MNEDNQEIEINLDDENENIDVNEENFIYVNIPEETIEEMQEDIEELKTDIQGKVDKVAGKGLSTEDYTTAEKNKLANLENYDDTEVKESIADLETKHDTEVAELNEKITELETDLEMATDIIPTGDASGSDITVNDSARYYFKKMVLGGKSEQETFTGKNLLQITYNVDGIQNGITFTSVKENGLLKYININGTSTAYIYRNLTDYNFGGIVINSSNPSEGGQYKGYIGTNEVKLMYAPNNHYTYIEIAPNKTFNNVKLYPMILLSSETDTSYEPYTGGQPAPNPDYESPIHNVTGDVEVKVETKNSFTGWTKGKGLNSTTGAEIINASAAVSDYISVDFETNPNYIMSGLDVNLYNIVAVYNSNKEFLGRTAGSRVEKRILTKDIFTGGTPQGTGDIAYLRSTEYEVSGQTGSIDNVDNLKTQLEPGSTATDYVPHEEQTVILPLPEGMEMCAVPNSAYVDSFEKREGKWYKKTLVRKLELAIADMNNNEDYPGWRNQTQLVNDYPGINLTISSVTKALSNITTAMNRVSMNTTTTGTLFLDKAYFGLTQTQWKQNYPDLIFRLYYGLQTPDYIEITDTTLIAQLDKLEKLYSYKGTTHITSEADLDVTYRKDLETIIDNLSNAIVAQGGI